MRIIESIIDLITGLFPSSSPPLSQLENAKLVAHRGGSDHSRNLIENSLEAFAECVNQNIWGVEFDVRFSLDDCPVIHHDIHAGRCWGRSDIVIAKTKLETLKKEIPQIATLDEALNLLSGRCHLMIEIKSPLTPKQLEVLKAKLSQLQPVEQYHLLALSPDIFTSLHGFSTECFVIVGDTNLKKLSHWSLKSSIGGIAGHYLLLNAKMQASHQKIGQKCGTGFIASKNCLWHELLRQVDWIFTDHPMRLKGFIDDEIKKLDPHRAKR